MQAFFADFFYPFRDFRVGKNRGNRNSGCWILDERYEMKDTRYWIPIPRCLINEYAESKDPVSIYFNHSSSHESEYRE